MADVADEDDAPAAFMVNLGFAVHLGDERAGGVDSEELARRGLLGHRFRDAVGGEDHRMGARGGFLEFLYEDDALGLERVDDEFVVHDLMAHVDRRPVKPERLLHNIDRPHDAGAKTARRTENDPQSGSVGGRGGLGHAAEPLGGGGGK